MIEDHSQPQRGVRALVGCAGKGARHHFLSALGGARHRTGVSLKYTDGRELLWYMTAEELHAGAYAQTSPLQLQDGR